MKVKFLSASQSQCLSLTMLSENQDRHGDQQLVSISKETMLEMVRRLSGFQNIDLVLQEKDSEIKQLRQTVSLLQSRLQELQEAVSGNDQRQSAAVNTDFQPSSVIHHRSSAPEIFVYPDMSKNSGGNNFNESNVLTARGSRGTQRENVKSNHDSRKPHFIQEQQMASSVEEIQGMSLRLDHDIGRVTGYKCEFMGGVSEQYFNNVVSELVKTKQYLYNLQKQGDNKVTPQEQQDNKAAVDALQQELKELQQQHEQLQRENVLLKSEVKGVGNVKKDLNDSFELEPKQIAEKHTQTDTDQQKLQLISPEVQQLKSEIARLTREKTELLKEKESYPVELDSLLREIDGLHKQIEHKTILYTQQRDSNKILSTCLQEEKERYKKLEDGYRENRTENRALVERLAHVRQQYEELRQEKIALEKSQSLLSGWSPAPSLISNNSNTSKGGHSRQHSNTSVASAGSDYAIAPARIQTDSGSFQEYSCPQCQQTYSIEKEYHIHIAKCCVD